MMLDFFSFMGSGITQFLEYTQSLPDVFSIPCLLSRAYI